MSWHLATAVTRPAYPWALVRMRLSADVRQACHAVISAPSETWLADPSGRSHATLSRWDEAVEDAPVDWAMPGRASLRSCVHAGASALAPAEGVLVRRSQQLVSLEGLVEGVAHVLS